ncbi:uncharacterized protein L969DRAFT_19282 [Mixia osmundae IAM 14324]|uniref:Ribosome biogenesis protein ERB1 n=1 Tax=Mixia osmundae (strain CBS 9802 / IAM 14324 / JCM 22182 / KY 12970) TaxID=764103 RepID=G7E535_MIXOS|nr:uncharacterized protein L969DRAFT_19282 [Mixia osmundae IAM 14324]KEI37807.1 hypothetical protein L969DRAFT_19282 [Mixia osmundae IAM 14324]GAA97945.1 hypothetical protein E5Q_04625 [Mixia osmundae IAM 14324]
MPPLAPHVLANLSLKAQGKRKAGEERLGGSNFRANLSFDSASDASEDAAELDDLTDEAEAFPEIDARSSGSSISDSEADLALGEEREEDEDEDDEEEETDEARILRELAEEAEIEADLAEEAEASSSDSDDETLAVDERLSRHIARSTIKPNEEDASAASTPAAFDHALNRRTLTPQQKDDLLGYEARDYKDRSKLVKSSITGEDKRVWRPVDLDDDEDDREPTNRIGNIPAHFYDGFPHIGYDIDGKRVLRPAKGDELDKFLANEEEAAWTSVQDKISQENVQLTEDELDLIHRLARSENPDGEYDPYTPQIEIFTARGLEMTMPLSGRPEPKSRFIPSKWEHKKVMKIVRAIRAGRIVPNKASAAPKPEVYNIWSDSDLARPDHPMNMPMPKLRLPTHVESYNPPAEYLFTQEELKEWEEAEPADRKLDFVPAKYDSLRKVPAFKDFVKQRFERCLDLYLAPRMRRRKPRLQVDGPEDLLPKLPSPNELRPFPTSLSILYPHPDGVRTRSISIDPTGMWVATGAEDGSVRLWECRVGRCAMTWQVADDGPIYNVEWCPDPSRSILAVASEDRVTLLSPTGYIDVELSRATTTFVSAVFAAPLPANATSKLSDVKWVRPSAEDREKGYLLHVAVPGTPKQVTWHRRGDYFASVSTNAGPRSVLIHQISKHQTQAPFTKSKGAMQKVAFHPLRPHFFVATQRYVRIYDLMAQKLVKTLQPGVKWISSLDVHPQGENVLIGSYDKKLAWHDLELSDRPYKTLRYHSRAIRSVSFSNRYPLFLSTSDDGTIQVFHSTVYSDLVTNPLIVPLKVLRGHGIKDGLGVLEAKWHPKEPWIASVGADGVGRLWTT